MTIVMPWPPQANHYYTVFRGRKILSKKGREYHKSIVPYVGKPLSGSLKVTITAEVPDRRRRDIDNLQKPILDSLTKAGYWNDDSQIDDLRIIRGDKCPGGRVVVVIERI